MVIKMRVFSVKLLGALLLLPSCLCVSAELEKSNIKAQKAKPIIIQSQVKGSQEQSKVIYIMPWQGIDKPISITTHQRERVLPTFKPINPTLFRKQVDHFYHKNKTLKK